MNTQKGQATPCERAETVWEERIPLQTIRCSFEQICVGEEPWIALGNFLHQFFGPYKYRREELVCEPLDVPEQCPVEQFRWAVFCAASVEYLCTKYAFSCPTWTCDPRYLLDDPWYLGVGAEFPHVQEELRITTPIEFSKRNIFCGDRTFNNKYEYKGRRGHRNSV